MGYIKWETLSRKELNRIQGITNQLKRKFWKKPKELEREIERTLRALEATKDPREQQPLLERLDILESMKRISKTEMLRDQEAEEIERTRKESSSEWQKTHPPEPEIKENWLVIELTEIVFRILGSAPFIRSACNFLAFLFALLGILMLGVGLLLWLLFGDFKRAFPPEVFQGLLLCVLLWGICVTIIWFIDTRQEAEDKEYATHRKKRDQKEQEIKLKYKEMKETVEQEELVEQYVRHQTLEGGDRLKQLFPYFARHYASLLPQSDIEKIRERIFARRETNAPQEDDPIQLLVDQFSEKAKPRLTYEVVQLGEAELVPEHVRGDLQFAGFRLWQAGDIRLRHTYVIGKTGQGKTTFLKHLIMQDLEQGNGIGVLAPDEQLFRDELLPFIPQERVKDVAYFNPEDRERPISFNPLHLDHGEDVDYKVSELMTIFKRAVGDMSARMDAILRNTFRALVSRQGSTLEDVSRVLSRTDASFRKEIIRDPNQDEHTKQFFEEEYPAFPTEARQPILNRLQKLTDTKSLRAMLCNTEKSFDFRSAIDDSLVLLFNLSDRVLGEDNSHLLGQLLLSKLQQAVFSRANIPEASRVPFYLYVDEFQHFTATASQTFADILTRARKYKLGLIFAHQNIAQISRELFESIIGNAHTLVAFQVADKDAKVIASELALEEDAEEDTRDYVLRLKTLPKWNALTKIGNHHTFITTPPRDLTPSQDAGEVIRLSRERFGSIYRERTPTQREEYPTAFEED